MIRDIYAVAEGAYRSALFCIIAGATGYLTYTSRSEFLIFNIIAVAFWLFFCLGVAGYLVFVAKGSFRPKEKQEQIMIEDCFEFINKQEKL